MKLDSLFVAIVLQLVRAKNIMRRLKRLSMGSFFPIHYKFLKQKANIVENLT
jgi:hypothetical protein